MVLICTSLIISDIKHLFGYILAIRRFSSEKISFPGGSDGKESACNAGDWGLIPGSGRPPEERKGYPLQYSCLEISIDRGLAGYSPRGLKESDTTERLTLPFCFRRNVVVIRPSRNQGKYKSSNAVIMVWRIRARKREGVEHCRTGQWEV